jgi:hypothetical protein
MHRGAVVLLVVFSLFTDSAILKSDELPSSSVAHVRLCDALEAIQAGDQLRVSFVAAYHNGLLYDPFEKICSRDVQPATILDLPSGAELPKELEARSQDKGWMVATFTGVLWAERRPLPDDLSLHRDLSYANRMGGFRRYGPGMHYRTKMVPEQISDFRPAAAVVNGPPLLHLRDHSPFPVVKEAALLSSYPWKAENAQVEGEVVVEVTVEKGKVAGTKILGGDRLLSRETVENIQTWTFDPSAEAIFITTFSYRFEDLPSTTASVRVHTELPVRVEVIAPRSNW